LHGGRLVDATAECDGADGVSYGSPVQFERMTRRGPGGGAGSTGLPVVALSTARRPLLRVE
jgi:hypothetical protein